MIEIKGKFERLSFLVGLAFLSTFLTGVGFANTVGPATHNLNPTADGSDFVSVNGSQTIGKKRYGLGLFLDIAVNTTPYFYGENSDYENSSRSEMNDVVATTHLSLAYGLTKNLDLLLFAPIVLFDSIKTEDSIYGEYNQAGLSELRLGLKSNLLKEGVFGLAGLASLSASTTKNNPYKGNTNTPTMSFEIAGDVDLSVVRLAANLGYKLANAGNKVEDEIEPYGDAVLFSGAASYHFANYAAVAEFFGQTPMQKEIDLSSRHTTVVETLYGIKWFQDEMSTIHGGLGTELRHGVSSADWRFYAGYQKEFGMASNPEVPKNEVFEDDALSVRDQADDVLVSNRVLFNMNSSSFSNREDAEYEIAKLAQKLNGKFSTIVIEGHTCSIGSKKYNNKLSRIRAMKIKRVLVRNHRIPSSKIKTAGYGERFPIASNASETDREENRRVEFRIYR